MGRISKAWRLLGVASVVVGLAAAAATTANASPIQHVVVLYQENHSFDNVLGRWCYNSGRCDGTLKGKLPSVLSDGANGIRSTKGGSAPAARNSLDIA